jgi:hypothetical protein
LSLWLASGIRAWRDQSRNIEKHLSHDVAASTASVIAGSLSEMPGINSLKTFGDIVKRIVSLAPVDLSGVTKAGPQKEIDRKFVWGDFLADNLRTAFQSTIDAVRLPNIDDVGGKSLTIIDDVLLELVGYMKLRNVQIPPISIAQG